MHLFFQDTHATFTLPNCNYYQSVEVSVYHLSKQELKSLQNNGSFCYEQMIVREAAAGASKATVNQYCSVYLIPDQCNS